MAALRAGGSFAPDLFTDSNGQTTVWRHVKRVTTLFHEANVGQRLASWESLHRQRVLTIVKEESVAS